MGLATATEDVSVGQVTDGDKFRKAFDSGQDASLRYGNLKIISMGRAMLGVLVNEMDRTLQVKKPLLLIERP